MLDPTTVYIDSTVEIGADTIIQPNTHLRGQTVIGDGSEIGPNSIVEDTTIGERCRVVASALEQSWVGNDVTIGPFAHLRPGARIEDEVELGNYAEVKASTIGPRSKIHHFSYTGDAVLGADVNVGAGTITCNYDGVNKHRTTVGAGVFIGSDTMLIAPVTLGDGSRTGAGSVVNKDVAPGQRVVGVPARPMRSKSASDAQAEASGSDSGSSDGADGGSPDSDSTSAGPTVR
jgi:bifunctional UDP-N-acetylglucosamine pyrophosphorylase/glucosamine-1-phosphate N-acetyltransferase